VVGAGTLLVWPLIGPASRPIAKTAVEGGLIAYREAEGLSRAATDDRSEQPRRETVPSCPGLSPLPRSVGLGRLCVDNNLLVAAVSLRPKPQEVPPPIPSRSALCFRSGPRLGLRADIIVLARHRTSAFGRKTGVRLLAGLHRSSHLGRVGLDLMAAPPASDDQADLRRRSAAEHRGRTVEDFIAASDGLQSQLPRINFDTT
jgi:hypothetical protein